MAGLFGTEGSVPGVEHVSLLPAADLSMGDARRSVSLPVTFSLAVSDVAAMLTLVTVELVGSALDLLGLQSDGRSMRATDRWTKRLRG